MKVNGSITMLINRENTRIELYDEDAATAFAVITLTPAQLSSAMSRLAYTPCDIELRNLERIGKKQETRTLHFILPRKYMGSKDTEELHKIAQSILDNETGGWEAEHYFASQDTFYEVNDVPYARCICRRWINKTE